nr:MAG TPA: hypothetical protein [Caudoviricetes sp.]
MEFLNSLMAVIVAELVGRHLLSLSQLQRLKLRRDKANGRTFKKGKKRA